MNPGREVFADAKLAVLNCRKGIPQRVAFCCLQGRGTVDECDNAVGIEKSDIFRRDNGPLAVLDGTADSTNSMFL